jgi:bifunctional non-homologous end joining protein LigD
VYLAGQGCITLHISQSRVDRPTHPDRLVIDLDPEEDDFGPVQGGAREVRAALDETGLPSWVMTTGSRGLHVVVPLDRTAHTDAVRGFASGIAELVVRRHPDRFTTEFHKEKRDGRVYVDILRNGYAQTAVAPYSVRPRPGAPVATPITWEELDGADMRPDRFDIRSVLDRLDTDPWPGIRRRARSLKGPAAVLRGLIER